MWREGGVQPKRRLQAMVDGLQHHFQIRISEWLLSGILTTFGLVCFFLPHATWQSIYGGLNWLGDQHVWGVAAGTLGLSRMIALFINGALYRTPHFRAVGAFLSIFIWLQLSFGLLTADTITLGLAVFPWFVIVDVHNLYRAGRDASFSDQKLRALRSGEAMRNAQPAQH